MYDGEQYGNNKGELMKRIGWIPIFIGMTVLLIFSGFDNHDDQGTLGTGRIFYCDLHLSIIS